MADTAVEREIAEEREARLLTAAAKSVLSLVPPVSGRDALDAELRDARNAVQRGYFLPDEDDRVRGRFARYLTARAGLLQTIAELEPIALATARDRLKAFAVAFAAACTLVHAAKVLVHELADHKIVQRKLNEPEPRLGIPAGQYTAVYRSLTSPFTAWRIRDAMVFYDANRDAIERLGDDDPLLSEVLAHLARVEQAVRVPAKRYVFARLRYRGHAIRRGRAVAAQQALFSILEIAGRVISELRRPWHIKRVNDEVCAQIAALLKPGDVIASRHDDAMTNLFLPGYWPHASLHVGQCAWCRELAQVPAAVQGKWRDPLRVLEAKKDGVLLRAIEETLAVDAVTILRPRLEPAEVACGIARALEHEGKLYDFNFDFFRTDRLVCTGVIYRAYHGLGDMRFTLKSRAGRPTLSCEDVLDMALDGSAFEVVGVYGTPSAANRLVVGSEARDALAASYRKA